MRRRLAIVLVLALWITSRSPVASAQELGEPKDGWDTVAQLKDGSFLVLEKLTGGPLWVTASGSVTAGCRLTAYNFLGLVIYSYTIWQEFSYDGVRITSFPPESSSSVAYWGWALTSDRHYHWWVRSPYTAAAKGEYAFTQYVAGQPFQSRSGWVQVNISGDGSWSCRSS